MNIAVMGLGHVGSVVAAGMAESGHQVTGLDVDIDTVQALQQGKSPFYEPGLDQLLRQGLSSNSFSAKHLDQVEKLNAEAIFIAVGTPSLPNGSADLSAVKSAMDWVAQKTAIPTVVVMKSTLPPGTGMKLAEHYCNTSGLELSYICNPEFLRQGQALEDWRHPDRIVIGGEDVGAIELVKGLHAFTEAPFIITDISSAEMIKYAANAFLTTKVSFINEMANLCDLLEADIDDVVRGIASDPRIGPSFLRPGIGYGGSCFPKDVRALDFLSTSNGYGLDLLRAVISVNNRQRLLPVHILRRELGNLHGREIAVLGLAFKPETDDIREAPAADIIQLLSKEGAKVRVYDCAAMPAASRTLPPSIIFARAAEEAISGAEAVVLCTEWEEFLQLDWKNMRSSMRPPYLVVDGRNALPADSLGKAGYRYVGIGRGRNK